MLDTSIGAWRSARSVEKPSGTEFPGMVAMRAGTLPLLGRWGYRLGKPGLPDDQPIRGVSPMNRPIRGDGARRILRS